MWVTSAYIFICGLIHHFLITMCPKIVVASHGEPSGNKKRILFLLLPVVALCLALYKQREASFRDNTGLITPTAGKRIHFCYVIWNIIHIVYFRHLKNEKINTKINFLDYYYYYCLFELMHVQKRASSSKQCW